MALTPLPLRGKVLATLVSGFVVQAQLLFLLFESGGVDFEHYPSAFAVVLLSAFVGAAVVAMQRCRVIERHPHHLAGEP